MADSSPAVFLSYASPAVAQPLWRGKQDAGVLRTNAQRSTLNV